MEPKELTERRRSLANTYRNALNPRQLAFRRFLRAILLVAATMTPVTTFVLMFWMPVVKGILLFTASLTIMIVLLVLRESIEIPTLLK